MTADWEFRDYVVDLLVSLGPVRAKAMFGGAGLYLDGTMFVIISDDILFLKADGQTQGDFEAQGMEPLTYERSGRDAPIALSYWETPPDVMDDADDLCAWARRAWEAARRSGDGRRGRKRT